MRPERTMDFRRPFRTDFVLDDEPDTLCLANFRLSRWDERRCQRQFGLDVWDNWRLNFLATDETRMERGFFLTRISRIDANCFQARRAGIFVATHRKNSEAP